jgi:hypothetical protein
MLNLDPSREIEQTHTDIGDPDCLCIYLNRQITRSAGRLTRCRALLASTCNFGQFAAEIVHN